MSIPAARDFGGSIPEYYDRYMGPAQFEAFGADLVRRPPTQPPGDVLEIACGTGIVTRRLRAGRGAARGPGAGWRARAGGVGARPRRGGSPAAARRETDEAASTSVV